MKVTLTSLVGSLILTPVLSYTTPSWSPAGPDDVRGPCPMLNTLANHGILPHSGKNITQAITLKALTDAVSFTPELGKFLFNFAMTTQPDKTATWFDLNHLGRHGILEHDASLSRTDKYFTTSDAFSQDDFDETTSYWKKDSVSLQVVAKSRHARAETSVKINPAFTFTPLAMGFAYGEVAAIPLVFGDKVEGTFPKAIVKYFFENERLPSQLGWKKPATPIGNLDLCEMTQRVINATGAPLEAAKLILPCSDFNV